MRKPRKARYKQMLTYTTMTGYNPYILVTRGSHLNCLLEIGHLSRLLEIVTLVIGQVAQVIMTANTNRTLKMIRIQMGNVPIKLKTRPVQRRKGKNLRLLMLEGYARQMDS